MSNKRKEATAQHNTPTKVHEAGKIAGFPITMAGIQHIVPPLNINGVEKHEADIEAIQFDRSISPLKKLDLLCNVILTALLRNYPSMTLDFVKEWVDMENVHVAFRAVMAQSGYTEASGILGEAKRAGSTGTTSTPASQPQQGGPSSTSENA